MNTLKTMFLFGLMSALLLFIGSMISHEMIYVMFAVALVLNIGSYWYSDKIVLRMYRAKEVTESEAPQLHRIVQRISERAGLPMPKVCIVPSASPNAFATGRNPKHAVVAVTEGALNLLNESELEGVVAHEVAHVADRDILISTIVAVMATTVMFLALILRWGAMFGGMGGGRNRQGGNVLVLLAVAIFAPIAAMIIRMAVSRAREYEADAQGARFAGNPDGLADALEKLHSRTQHNPMNAQPATAHMFIVNPLAGRRDFSSLFSTHPPAEERIRRLRNMHVYS